MYESIDKRMDERRKIKREERLKEEIKRYRMEKPKIQQQFEDIKRELGTMSPDDWSAIPDVANMTRTKKNKVILRRIRTFNIVVSRSLVVVLITVTVTIMIKVTIILNLISFQNTRAERFTPVPDSMIERIASQQGHSTYASSGIQTALPGTATSLGMKTPAPGQLDLLQIGVAKNSMLGVKLDQVSISFDILICLNQ